MIIFMDDSGGSPPSSIPVLVSSQYSSGGADATTSSLALTNPAGIVTGDLILAICVCDSTGGAPNMSTATTGWTKINEVGSSAVDVQIAVFWKIATGSSDAMTVDLSTARRLYAFAVRVTGAHASTPIHVSSFNESASTSSVSITGVTTSVANCLIIAALGVDGGPTFTWSGGFTKVADDSSSSIQMGCSFAQKDLATAGASGTATVTLSANEPNAFCQVAIQPP